MTSALVRALLYGSDEFFSPGGGGVAMGTYEWQ